MSNLCEYKVKEKPHATCGCSPSAPCLTRIALCICCDCDISEFLCCLTTVQCETLTHRRIHTVSPLHTCTQTPELYLLALSGEHTQYYFSCLVSLYMSTIRLISSSSFLIACLLHPPTPPLPSPPLPSLLHPHCHSLSALTTNISNLYSSGVYWHSLLWRIRSLTLMCGQSTARQAPSSALRLEE